MSIDSRYLRNALGQFATGVCVITADNREGVPFGMTINSFASLSLDPALVIWSIAKTSECFDEFSETERYAINVLKQDQQALSSRYSKRGEHALIDGDWSSGVTGIPVLQESLACFECEIHERVDGGDHVILIGRVKDVAYLEDESPLLFFSGAYRTLS